MKPKHCFDFDNVNACYNGAGKEGGTSAHIRLFSAMINGTTIHHLLSLPVEHGKPADYSRLQQEQLSLIRATLKDLKLIIIDKMRMVSSLTLLYIHLRLTEVTTSDEAFGRISIVCFRDSMHLPPQD